MADFKLEPHPTIPAPDGPVLVRELHAGGGRASTCHVPQSSQVHRACLKQRSPINLCL
jgi:hypothetical protein